MNPEEKIEAFVLLKEKIDALQPEEVAQLASQARQQNGWFTEESVSNALQGISFMLNKQKLNKWIASYELTDAIPKVVGIVMAGNIPLVGFHDLLCVLLSGNVAAIKPSTDDVFLTHKLIDWITAIEPRFRKDLSIRDKLTNVDAVIATGSDNTARYFEYYFKGIPHIIRKNRTSVAILNGNEKPEDIRSLGVDIFSYFGLGCRNVSKLFTPEGYDIREAFPLLQDFEPIIHHHKYRNNYDYHKSIYLINKTPHLDTGFLLTVSSDELVSPISVLYHQEYDQLEALEHLLETQNEKIQCIVGENHTPFGQAQRPELWDYADNVDTLDFLTRLGS